MSTLRDLAPLLIAIPVGLLILWFIWKLVLYAWREFFVPIRDLLTNMLLDYDSVERDTENAKAYEERVKYGVSIIMILVMAVLISHVFR